MLKLGRVEEGRGATERYEILKSIVVRRSLLNAGFLRILYGNTSFGSFVAPPMMYLSTSWFGPTKAEVAKATTTIKEDVVSVAVAFYFYW
jgi:hypothetical protein